MKRIVVIVAAAVILSRNCWAEEPKWQEITRGIVNVRSVLVDQEDPRVLYAGTARGIFKTEDGASSWRNILTLRGVNQEVNQLVFGAQDKRIIYAATGAGLYFSPDNGIRWKRIFKGKNNFENECETIAVLPYGIYLGTKFGLFVSKDQGRSWHKEPGKLGNSRIFNIAYSDKEPDCLYVSCANGIFRSADSAKSWERVFIAHPEESSLEEENESEERNGETLNSEIRYVAVDPNNPNHVYLASNCGIYKSKDRGAAWELLPEYGLLSRDTQFILISNKSKLYAATRSGVFTYGAEEWIELSFNLSARKVISLGLYKDMDLFACTDKGLFKTEADHVGTLVSGGVIAEYSKDEPKIGEIQKEAIKYAEVDPEKIIKWRRQAQNKAVLPQVSLGLDRSTTDLWHWEGGSTTRSDDDTLRRGRDSIDWSVSLSWNLGELIWNDDQTSIDARSRLMVQLRDDILDEVNKLYFERIRVKMEMDSLQIEDRKKRFEKELRLKELTASLDALTGGYFSSHIKATTWNG